MGLLAGPNFTIPEASHLIRSDAAFATEVLRLANSAMLGLRYEVTSVMHAISVLGMERLRNLVLTVAMRDFVRGAKPRGLLRLSWRHNLAAALLAEALAEPCFIEKSDGYTAGLLHDLGRLALAAAYPAEYARVMQCSAGGGQDLFNCETSILGISHCDAGLVLAEKWGLPSMIRELLCMRVLSQTGPFTVLRLATVACSMSDRLGFSLGECKDSWDPAWLQQQLPPDAWPRMASKVDALADSIPLKINSFECEFLTG